MSGILLSWTAMLLLLLLAGLVLLKESRQGRIPLAFGLLLLALVELFDSLAIQRGERFSDYKRVALFFKSLIPAAFLLYGMLFARRREGGSRLLSVAPLLGIAVLLSSSVFVIPVHLIFADVDLQAGRVLVLGPIGYWYYLGLMIFCIAALVNLESVFSRIRGTDRWRVKYEFLGVGAILAVLIFYFSQGLLYRSMNLSLLPVRSGVMIVSVLLIAYARLFRGSTTSLVVSRQALYRSISLVAVGLYLLVLGLVGEGMRRFGVSVTPELAVFIAILSGVAFLALLLSEEIRLRLRILITKHFYATKHDYRDEWLGFSNALAECHSLREVQAAIVDRYRKTFGLSFCALYVREAAGDSFLLVPATKRPGLPGHVTLTAGLLGYFAETGRVINPEEGEYTPTAEELTFIRDAEAWLLVPLLAGDRLEAFAVFGRQIVPENLTYEDFDLMKTLGRQAVLSLSNFRLSEELAESREMAAIAKVSSFVIHDLKNVAYAFSLMLDNAERYIGEPDFQRDMIKSLRNTVLKMNDLIAKLKAFPQKMELKKQPEDVERIVRETAEEVQRLMPAVSIAAELAPSRALVDGAEVRKVVLNLLLNACEASEGKGRVLVKAGEGEGGVWFSVQDAGCGMSETFIKSHLFRPFRTTKDKGLGIGLFQCRQIIEGHGGRIDVTSGVGKGTIFTVSLPRGW